MIGHDHERAFFWNRVQFVVIIQQSKFEAPDGCRPKILIRARVSPVVHVHAPQLRLAGRLLDRLDQEALGLSLIRVGVGEKRQIIQPVPLRA